MAAPISVIIPTLNAASELPWTLESLTPGLGAGVLREVVIADGGSTDAIADLADAVGARFVESPPGRGPQLAAGAAAARGDWLLFLHADTVLSPNWPDVVAAHLRRGADQAAWFQLNFDDPSFMARWTAGWANLRSRMFALPYGDQGVLISRPLYDAIGGYKPLAIMEDVDLAQRLGWRRLTGLPITATTSAARYRRDGWIRRGLRNWRCQAQWRLGGSADQVARRY